MSKQWYGSIENRIDENKMFCEKIEEGTKMTEYSWSDRHAYEVVKVIDQKHVFVRRLKATPKGDTPMSNEWELTSDVNNPILELVYRYNAWHWKGKCTKESIKKAVFIDKKVYDKVMQKGEVVVYSKANVSFGIADEYFDYEF